MLNVLISETFGHLSFVFDILGCEGFFGFLNLEYNYLLEGKPLFSICCLNSVDLENPNVLNNDTY